MTTNNPNETPWEYAERVVDAYTRRETTVVDAQWAKAAIADARTRHQPPAVPLACTWTFHADDFNCVWNKTACGINDAVFGEEDRFKFCPYCGGKIQRDATTVGEVMGHE